MAKKKAAQKKAAPTKKSAAKKVDIPQLSTSKIQKMTKDEAIKALSDTMSVMKAMAPSAAGPGSLAPSTNFTRELNNINFAKMIGGPLQAAIEAQTASAMATIDFINQIGFKGEGADRELVMVDFDHKEVNVAEDGTPVETERKLRVPLLAMLPIPSIRIETVDIDFNVKLNSVETSNVSNKIGVNAEVKAGWGPVNIKVSASYQRKSSTGVEVKKEYALNVKVKATQDEMPAGLEKILNIISA